MSTDSNLILGDCYEKLLDFSDKSIDLIIMDPPYQQQSTLNGAGAFGTNNRHYYEEIVPISKGVTNELLDLLVAKMKKINIYIYCNKKQLLQYLTYFEKFDVSFDLLTWHKTNPIPAVSNVYLRDTEFILFFREKGVKLYGNYLTKRTYYITPVNKKDKNQYNHPTVKPVEQCINFITNSSIEGDVVLDPFMGSGTCGVACKKLNRKFIGIEINEAYYNTAVARISDSM